MFRSAEREHHCENLPEIHAAMAVFATKLTDYTL